MISLPKLVLLLVIVILVFGATRLPAIGAGLGQGIRNFRDSLKGDGKDDNKKLPG